MLKSIIIGRVQLVMIEYKIGEKMSRNKMPLGFNFMGVAITEK